MAGRSNKPTWWILVYLFLSLYGCLLFYIGLVMSPYYGMHLATAREQMTDVLMMAFLPGLLLGLRREQIAEWLLYGLAALNALLGLFELRIPNALDDAFADVPNRVPFGERALFLIFPAIAGAILVRYNQRIATRS